MRTFFQQSNGQQQIKGGVNLKQINLDCFRNMTVVSDHSGVKEVTPDFWNIKLIQKQACLPMSSLFLRTKNCCEKLSGIPGDIRTIIIRRT